MPAPTPEEQNRDLYVQLAEKSPEELQQIADDLEAAAGLLPPGTSGFVRAQPAIIRVLARDGLEAALERFEELVVAEHAGIVDPVDPPGN